MGSGKGHTQAMKVNSMGSVKTAVSLDSELFKQLEEVAKSCGQSRSAVVAVALRKYLLD